jgi:T-complex protein 1 subunit delta
MHAQPAAAHSSLLSTLPFPNFCCRLLAPIAADAILRIIDPATATNVDLRDVAVVKKLGGILGLRRAMQLIVLRDRHCG